MRPKLLVGLSERNTWNQSQKPLEGQRVVCGEVHALFETEAVAHIYSGQVDDHIYFFHEHSQEAVSFEHKVFS